MKNSTAAGCFSGVFVLLGMTGCASVPGSMQELPWTDTWGDRGMQVRGRDLVMCSELIESRRSFLAGCMAQRGWILSLEVPAGR